MLWCMGTLLFAASPALASTPFPAGSRCSVSVQSDTAYSDVASDKTRWSCDQEDWSISSPRTILTIDLGGRVVADNETFVTRLTRFSSLRLTSVGIDGSHASKTVSQKQMTQATGDWLMSTPLPALDVPVKAVILEVDKPRHLGMISDARIDVSPARDNGLLRVELLLAALCGILSALFIFNIAFFQVLRERFVLWHAAAVFWMLMHTFVTSGLINRFFAPSMLELHALSVFSWGAAIMAAGMFIKDLVEPGKLDPIHKRLIYGLALWVAAWSAFHVFVEGPLRALSAPLYYASFIPVLGGFIWIMSVALQRGSRAIKFQIVAWLPLMLTGAIRIVSSLGLTDVPLEMMAEQHISLALEVAITTLGVADRFMVIKRQRDNAVAQTKVLGSMAEHDPLTGLFNRHGLEERFELLYESGFDTLAILDLDHFKDVNDTYGHTVGDQVLKAVANTLKTDANAIAMRIGGEEFLLFLRGSNAPARAERLRKSIPLRVAREVEGLHQPITASMGLVEQPRDARTRCDFATLYAQSDKLLYEAKAAGRNRSMTQKMRLFEKPAPSTAGAKAIAAV